jgi:hydroxypyruvate reductase
MNLAAFAHMREVATDIFRRTLSDINVHKVLSNRLESTRGVLRICDDLYDLNHYSRIFVVSMGKAAHPMIETLAFLTGPMFSGVAVAGDPAQTQVQGVRYFDGGHPLPSSESIRAAEAILKALNSLDHDCLAIFLISGGASAMVEQAIDPEISLGDLIETYRVLVHSGAPIGQMNAIRKHLSAVKGGRLAQAAYPAQQVSVLVSDVPEHALDALASGPTMPDSSTTSDCYEIARQYDLPARLPASVRTLFEARALEETPKNDDPIFVRSRWWTVLSSETAAKSVAKFASANGFATEIDNACDDWDYARAADYLLDRLRALRQGVSRACIISAGEVTVRVDRAGARGGRNQQFALYCAQKITGENIAVLSAGTDGIDGNSKAAGAVADGSTVERARSTGIDPVSALNNFESAQFFQALGDAVVTGPTGNNVRDLRVLLAW